MRHQLSRDEYRQLRAEIDWAQMNGAPRYLRAKQSTDQIVGLLKDFLPRDDECLQRVYRDIFETFFFSNSAIINVPPEKDALDKLALERAMLETLAPIIKVE